MSKLISFERKSQTMPVLRGRGSLTQAKLQQFSTMDTSLTLNMGNCCTPVILFPFILGKIALCYMIFCNATNIIKLKNVTLINIS